MRVRFRSVGVAPRLDHLAGRGETAALLEEVRLPLHLRLRLRCSHQSHPWRVYHSTVRATPSGRGVASPAESSASEPVRSQTQAGASISRAFSRLHTTLRRDRKSVV